MWKRVFRGIFLSLHIWDGLKRYLVFSLFPLLWNYIYGWASAFKIICNFLKFENGHPALFHTFQLISIYFVADWNSFHGYKKINLIENRSERITVSHVLSVLVLPVYGLSIWFDAQLQMFINNPFRCSNVCFDRILPNHRVVFEQFLIWSSEMELIPGIYFDSKVGVFFYMFECLLKLNFFVICISPTTRQKITIFHLRKAYDHRDRSNVG